MFSALKLLGIWAAKGPRRCTNSSLFSGSAYFSNRVPKAFTEKWVAHGGEISSGTAFDVRARYFFAMDPLEPWVVKLFSKSVVAIHAGWIANCVDEAFQVPISEYILDDRFTPGPPYKLANSAPPVYVPLCEPRGKTCSESGLTPVQTSETPSTPTSTSRKRKREQAYFDSPSGFLVFSGFDKDGMPQRPRKQRKLRFDPSFSPESGRPARDAIQDSDLDLSHDQHDTLIDDDGFNEEHDQDTRASALRDQRNMVIVRSPDTPDKPTTFEGLPATPRRLPKDEDILEPTRVSSPTISIDKQEKEPPVRGIDFTRLPPRTNRWRFHAANTINSKDSGTTLSIVKSTDYKVKTPKKISFADRARVCVYMVSPQRPAAKDNIDARLARQCLEEKLEDASKVSDKTRVSSDGVEGPDKPATEAIKDQALQNESSNVKDDPARHLEVDQDESNTLTLKMEQVQMMRRRLVELKAMDGVDDSQLATLFELGKTFRGMAFRHVW